MLRDEDREILIKNGINHTDIPKLSVDDIIDLGKTSGLTFKGRQLLRTWNVRPTTMAKVTLDTFAGGGWNGAELLGPEFETVLFVMDPEAFGREPFASRNRWE